MNQRALFRSLKQSAPPNVVPEDDWELKELQAIEQDPSAKLKFDNVPTVGCGTIDAPKKIIVVKFTAEPKLKNGEPTIDQKGKSHAWTEGTLVKATKGWDKATQSDVQLEAGAKVNVDLARHKGFWLAMKSYAAQGLTGRTFAMATVGRVKTKNGTGFDYRVREIKEE